MKKFLFCLLPLFLNAINYEIICQNQSNSTDTKGLPFIFHSFPYYNIYDGGFVEGALDTVNSSVSYWDDTSAICGGEVDENILITAHCDDSKNSACWDVMVGKGSGIEIITQNAEDGLFYNNVNFVNGYPCLPRETKNFTVGLYSQSSGNDYSTPFQNANLNTYVITNRISLTPEEANTYRNVCSPITAPNTDYTEQLNQLIENTSENKNIKELNERDKKLDTDLESFVSNIEDNDTTENDLLEFETAFQTTLNDTFLNYSDVFGFGGYGSAPSPISFSMLGNTYEVFNISIIDDYVDLIRNIFTIFAYLWGIIIVFRSV